jgi:hypothetical protein
VCLRESAKLPTGVKEALAMCGGYRVSVPGVHRTPEYLVSFLLALVQRDPPRDNVVGVPAEKPPITLVC